MSIRQPLTIGQLVKYRVGALVYPAKVQSDLEDDIYGINVDRHGQLNSSIPAHRSDIYSTDDLPYLVDDLFGVSEDALAEIHDLLNQNSVPLRDPSDRKAGSG